MQLGALTLSHFRNHPFKEFHFSKNPTVFFGENGAGKTNILEALSYFSVGRGLKGAKMSDLLPFDGSGQETGWAIALTLMQGDLDQGGSVRLSSHYMLDKRINKIQGEIVKSSTAFSEWVSVFWLTPEHDRLFTDSGKVRRKFLDRMVFSYHPLHAKRLLDFEALMKERLSLLSQTQDDRWLSALERKMADAAVEIAFARQALLDRLEFFVHTLSDAFPKFTCSHKGMMEEMIHTKSKEQWHQWYQDQWRSSRALDAKTHMTHVGVHRSDFSLMHATKGESHTCSTGEQKILLMGLVLSFLKSRLEWDDKLVVILLDECVSHFDFSHRMVLFEQILILQNKSEHPGTLHAIMTGTDRHLFAPLEDVATFYHIVPSVEMC